MISENLRITNHGYKSNVLPKAWVINRNKKYVFKKVDKILDPLFIVGSPIIS